MSSEKAESITKDVEAGEKRPASLSAASEGSVPFGVATVEASNKVYGKYSKWALFISCVSLPFPSSLLVVGWLVRC